MDKWQVHRHGQHARVNVIPIVDGTYREAGANAAAEQEKPHQRLDDTGDNAAFFAPEDLELPPPHGGNAQEFSLHVE